MGTGFISKQAWPTTHWSLVAEAGVPDTDAKRTALTKLITQYQPVLRWHLVIRRRIDSAKVDDLLQEFLLSSILEKEILNKADQSRGRFRNYLATVLDRFISVQLRHERRMKRQPDQLLSIEDVHEPIDAVSLSDDGFEYAWARQVLGQAVRRMKIDCSIRERPDLWGVFKERLLRAAFKNKPTPYRQFVHKLGIASPQEASNLLVTANRKFVRILRGVIATYEKDESEIEQELLDLWHAARRPRAR